MVIIRESCGRGKIKDERLKDIYKVDVLASAGTGVDMVWLGVVVVRRIWGCPSSSPIGRPGVVVGTVVVDTRAKDIHRHRKLVDTEG